jgi:26S proteasome regulatory subunit T5
MRSETLRLQHEQSVMKEKIRDNGEKIKQNKVLPYLVGNVVEVRFLPRTDSTSTTCLYIVG